LSGPAGSPPVPPAGSPETAPAGAGGLEQVIAAIEGRLPGAVLATRQHRGETTAVVDPARIVEICRFLKEEPGLEYVFLVDLFGIHWMDRDYSYEVVYYLHSFRRSDRIRLKARLGEAGRIPTLTGVHPGANWHEREAFDLVGITFVGHPDLRRILMPEDYDANPLRKDFPMKGY
jgi:NADH-quinone oxidoreductase subunit C